MRPGTAWAYLDAVRHQGVDVHGRFGWELAGAWATAMRNDSEVLLLWAVPTWEDWAAFEAVQRTDENVAAWRTATAEQVVDWERFLLVDSPLCPFRTGRQPQESDRDSFQLPD